MTDLDALYRLHAASLCRAMHALTGCPHTAQDIVQDTFAFVWTRRHELEDGPAMRAYLYRVAFNRMRHRIRGAGRLKRAMERWFAEPRREPPGPDDAVAASERALRIHAVIGEVPLVYREVFVLFELQELSGAEIAAILEIEPSTVWTRLHRARKAFRDAWAAKESP